ncbi:MAG TPA: FlgD immunoglobulin-like domain containing protein [bacterium]|nr:FlgD immunoglobulin-like domain containing protein [bacterium]
MPEDDYLDFYAPQQNQISYQSYQFSSYQYFLSVPISSYQFLSVFLSVPISQLCPPAKSNFLSVSVSVLDGSSTLSGEIGIVFSGPERFELPAVWPNPTRGSTQLSLRLRGNAGVELVIFNMLGQRVRRIEAGMLSAGDHLLRWEGRDDAGVALPPGEYLIQARVEGRVEVRRVTLVR